MGQGKPAGRRLLRRGAPAREQPARPCPAQGSRHRRAENVRGRVRPEPVRKVLPHLGAGAGCRRLAAYGTRRRIRRFHSGHQPGGRQGVHGPRHALHPDAERRPGHVSRETTPAVRTGYRQNPDEYLLRRLPPPHPARRGRPRRPRGRTGEKGQRRTVAGLLQRRRYDRPEGIRHPEFPGHRRGPEA